MGASRIIGYEFHISFFADLDKHCVLRGNETLERPLTSKEFEVLVFFLQHPHEVIARDKVEPLQDAYYARLPVDDYISKICKKLEIEREECFRTVRKVGYELTIRVLPRFEAERQEAGHLFRASDIHFNQHTKASLDVALDQSKEVLTRHPEGFAESRISQAYILIDLAHDVLSARLPSECIPLARAEAEKALATDERAAAFGVLGLIALIYDYDWSEAERLLNTAVELDPREASSLLTLAHLHISQGRREEGLKAIERAVQANPLDQIIYASWGWIYLLAGDAERAEHLGEQARLHFPLLPPAQVLLGQAYEANEKFDKAIESYKRALELEVFPGVFAALGHIHGRLGHRTKARFYLREISRLHEDKKTAYVSGYCQALVHAGLGEQEECLAALDRAYLQRCDWLIHLGVEPRWSSVRHLSRFLELMRKVGVPDQSTKSAAQT